MEKCFFFFLRREVYKGQFSPTYHVLLLLLLIEGWVSFPPQLRHLLLVTQLTVCWGLRPNRDECLKKEDFALAFPPFTFWWVPLKGRNESVPWMWIFDDNICVAELYSFQSMLIFIFYHCLVKLKNVKFHNCFIHNCFSHLCRNPTGMYTHINSVCEWSVICLKLSGRILMPQWSIITVAQKATCYQSY